MEILLYSILIISGILLTLSIIAVIITIRNNLIHYDNKGYERVIASGAKITGKYK